MPLNAKARPAPARRRRRILLLLLLLLDIAAQLKGWAYYLLVTPQIEELINRPIRTVSLCFLASLLGTIWRTSCGVLLVAWIRRRFFFTASHSRARPSSWKAKAAGVIHRIGETIILPILQSGTWVSIIFYALCTMDSEAGFFMRIKFPIPPDFGHRLLTITVSLLNTTFNMIRRQQPSFKAP